MINMILLLIICPGLLLLAWAAQRDDFKRILGIAIALVPIKYFIFVLLQSARNEAFSFVVIFFSLINLPEMLAGEYGQSKLGSWILTFCVGVLWNLLPAYFISSFLADSIPAQSGKNNNEVCDRI
jgi:hypothetical protein